MIDNVHVANRILLSFITRERKHREHVFRKDPVKLEVLVGQCISAAQHLEHMIQGGPVSVDKSFHFIKRLIKNEEFWRGKIFQGQQREDKLADCAQAYAALLFLHEALAPALPEQLSLLG